mgnify:CR=1 FL=1
MTVWLPDLRTQRRPERPGESELLSMGFTQALPALDPEALAAFHGENRHWHRRTHRRIGGDPGVEQPGGIGGRDATQRHESREMVFRENMVIVIQPNLMTYDEKMGLQFGETLVVKKNGCESLNAYPRQWVTCSG